MADQSDVENALVQLVLKALYPQGTNFPSVCSAPCRIYRGWPNSAALDGDLAAGLINVTVFPAGQSQRTTTRYPTEWKVTAVQQPSLTVAVSGTTVTFQGSAQLGQLAGLIVDGRTYVCRTEPGDSPALIAAKLAAQSRLDAITNLSGSSLTVPGASKIIARVAADAEAVKEIRRQLQDFRISCWCPTPESRDAAASAIDQSLANMQFFDLPDSTSGRLVFQSSTTLDQSQDAALYRRDLLYSVEYATTQNATQPAMLFGAGTINAAAFIG